MLSIIEVFSKIRKVPRKVRLNLESETFGRIQLKINGKESRELLQNVRCFLLILSL